MNNSVRFRTLAINKKTVTFGHYYQSNITYNYGCSEKNSDKW